MGSHQMGLAERERTADKEQPASSSAPVQVTGAPGATSQAILRMQRAAGNRATVATLARSSPRVQRDVEVDEGVEKLGGVLDFSGGQIGNFASWGGLAGDSSGGRMYEYGNTNTPGAQGGEAGSVIGGVASMVSIGTGIRDTAGGIGKMRKHQTGSAGYHEGARQAKSGALGVAGGMGNLGSQSLNFSSALSQVAANAGSTSHFASMNNLLGGVGGIVALPVAALATVRGMWKTGKQYARFRRLREGLENAEKAKAEKKDILKRQDEAIEEARKTRATAESDVTAAEQELAKAKKRAERKATKKSGTKTVVDLSGLESTVEQRKQVLTVLDQLIAKLQRERDTTERAVRAAEQAVLQKQARAQRGEESPEDIRAYALSKNNAGWWKKLVGVVGGLLGIGGGIAGTIAAFAAIGATAVVATASLATPIGWGLCGAAALVGIAMAGYAFWKWASKRYARLKEANPGKSRWRLVLMAINPFVNAGKSHREHMADRLYDLASDSSNAEAQQEAKQVIRELGLDYDGESMDAHPEASKKLIADKMKS